MKELENNLKKLENWCDGSFAILIIGESGTGKSSILKELIRLKLEKRPDYKYYRLDCMSSMGKKLKCFRLDSHDITNPEYVDLPYYLNREYINLMIFDHLDYLPMEKQVELFEHLSTRPGRVIDSTGKILPQIIGLVSTPMVQLYGNSNWLDPLLDRFAQQIIIMDPLKNFTKDRLYTELKRTWEFMQFKDVSKNFEEVYSEDKQALIRNWLFGIKSALRGNYRDLDVIAINLWRGVIEEVPPEDTLANLEYIVGTLQNNPNHSFKIGVEADVMIKEFRKELIQWAEQAYPDTSTLLNTLKISEKTSYNWKNLK